MNYEALKNDRNARNIFARRMGIRTEKIGPGYAIAKLCVGPEDVNPAGTPHGGCYFSVADTACGSAMASRGGMGVTVNASYNFLRSGKPGDTVTAEAREVKSGRTLCIFEVRLTDQNDVLLGTGTFTFYRIAPPSPEN